MPTSRESYTPTKEFHVLFNFSGNFNSNESWELIRIRNCLLETPIDEETIKMAQCDILSYLKTIKDNPRKSRIVREEYNGLIQRSVDQLNYQKYLHFKKIFINSLLVVGLVVGTLLVLGLTFYY